MLAEKLRPTLGVIAVTQVARPGGALHGLRLGWWPRPTTSPGGSVWSSRTWTGPSPRCGRLRGWAWRCCSGTRLRLWPGIAIGDLLLADFSTLLGTVVGQTVGNTLALIVAALLLRRLGARASLERTYDVLMLVLCAVAAALVSAAFGPMALRLGGVVPTDELGRVFRTWTLSDATGVLVSSTGLVVTWAASGLRGIRRRDVIEGLIGLAVLVVLAELAPQRDVPYIVFPVLSRAALRLGPRGAATAILVVSSITVWNTSPERRGRSSEARSRTASLPRSSSWPRRRSRRSCSRP